MRETPAVEEIGVRFHSPFTPFSNLGDSSPIDAVWYTPLAQCANWFGSLQDWSDLKELVNPESNSPNGHIFRTFFRKGKDFDCKLTLDLLRGGDFTLACSAFRDSLASRPNPQDMEVTHGILQLLVMDRLLYFRNGRNKGFNHSPIFISPRSFARPDKYTEPYVKVCLSWSDHIAQFISAWDLHLMKIGGVSRDSGNSGIVSSLTDGLNRSIGKTRVAKAEGNFCLTALAIRALLIVSDMALPAFISFTFNV